MEINCFKSSFSFESRKMWKKWGRNMWGFRMRWKSKLIFSCQCKIRFSQFPEWNPKKSNHQRKTRFHFFWCKSKKLTPDIFFGMHLRNVVLCFSYFFLYSVFLWKIMNIHQFIMAIFHLFKSKCVWKIIFKKHKKSKPNILLKIPYWKNRCFQHWKWNAFSLILPYFSRFFYQQWRCYKIQI